MNNRPEEKKTNNSVKVSVCCLLSVVCLSSQEFPSNLICTSEQSHDGNSNSIFPSLCFTAAENAAAVHSDIETRNRLHSDTHVE